MRYLLKRQIDENSETDLTKYRSAFGDVEAIGKFHNARNSSGGLDVAIPLLRKVKFHWAEHSVNPIGDIMSSNLFSVRAADIIRKYSSNLTVFEVVDIEGCPAFFIMPKQVNGMDSDENIFTSRSRRGHPIVSDLFKQAWEAAGLLGAEFEPINE